KIVEDLEEFGRLLGQAEAAHQHSGPEKSQFLQVAEFLLADGNRPRSASAILKGTGLSRTSLSQLFHVTHKDSFISNAIPGYARKKKWSLSEQAATDAKRQLDEWHTKKNLFGVEGDLAGLTGKECCVRILKDHGNEAMGPLALAREAIARGYRGTASGL